jgi:ADP-heptose:LPS heptosyltransferase/lauroyl/myristoyl acyltransferase
MLADLHHAFPEMPRKWQSRTAITSCRQTVENRFLAIALPFLSTRRLFSMLHLTEASREKLIDIFSGRTPTVLAIPQIGAWELATVLPLACRNPAGVLAIPYKRIENGKLERWLRRGRERFGVRILRQDDGFVEGLSILHQNGAYGILFDQTHPIRGIRTTLLNRLTTVQELPGLLVDRFDAQLFGFYTERISFWHYAVRVRSIDSDYDAGTITIGLNRWLENLIRSNDNACGSWSWGKDRWDADPLPGKAFHLDRREVTTLPDQDLPRNRRLWVRLPDDLGQTLRAVPVLRALRQSRPDGAITVLGRRPFLDLLRPSGLFESEIPLPEHGINVRLLVDLQLKYPDVFLTLTDTTRSDLEAWLIGCAHRFGFTRSGQDRPLLTDIWEVPETLDERTLRETRFLQQFLAHFGMRSAPDYSPINVATAHLSAFPSSGHRRVVGLLCSTRPEPADRWPLEYWKALAESLVRRYADLHVLLLGSAGDRASVDTITDRLPEDRFTDLARKTSPVELAGSLAICDLVIATESAGMHLANAQGVPVVGLYGPGNPIQTGPVFNAPCQILLPPGCRPTGGSPVSGIQPSSVMRAVERHFDRFIEFAAAS